MSKEERELAAALFDEIKRRPKHMASQPIVEYINFLAAVASLVGLDRAERSLKE